MNQRVPLGHISAWRETFEPGDETRTPFLGKGESLAALMDMWVCMDPETRAAVQGRTISAAHAAAILKLVHYMLLSVRAKLSEAFRVMSVGELERIGSTISAVVLQHVPQRGK